MFKKAYLFLLLFLFTGALIQANSQTLFMAENAQGAGFQYAYINIDEVKTTGLAIGISKNRRADLAYVFTRSSMDIPSQSQTHSFTTGMLQLTLFPSKEWQGDFFTNEVLLGAGYSTDKLLSGGLFMVGTGISKGKYSSESNIGIRPRLSAAYTLFSGKPRGSDTRKIDTDIVFSPELILERRYGQVITLLISSAYHFYPQLRTGGLSLSASLIL